MTSGYRNTTLVPLDTDALRVMVGAVVRDLRQHVDSPHVDLAARCGISPQAWYRIEHAKCFPSVPTLYRICRVIDLNVDRTFQLYDQAIIERGSSTGRT